MTSIINPDVCRHIAEYANGYYQTNYDSSSCMFNRSRCEFNVSHEHEEVVIANFDEVSHEVIFNKGTDVAVFRIHVSRFQNKVETPVREHTYDTSMDPISPDFNPSSWEPIRDGAIDKLLAVDPNITQVEWLDTRPRSITDLFLNITKETMVSDIVVVEEHRCDIHDTQAQMASQLMAAYNVDHLVLKFYSGMEITFRKVKD